MSKGTIQVICGEGKGKTTAALGMGISALLKGQTVIMIQFLKGCQELASCEILERMEPMNIRNGMNFARKVLSTGECDLVILDEVLGLLDQGIIEMDEMTTLLQSRVEEIDLILTGKVFPKELDPLVDGIREIDHLKVDNTKQ